ncbi:hypothetical protein [Stenotrophomonas sp.]|uniref:hypothetical protein n=1 Tax=Stenotrophomonas sp. TaxID=69392 RepID=UPI0028A8C161|nr:hypothetical protein [Stenotrophomonas sp.]
MFSIDWTAISVGVAALVFFADRRHKQQRLAASSTVVMEFLAQDMIRLARQSREMGMYTASLSVGDLGGSSRADSYLTQRAEQLSIATLERHAADLSSLPTAVVKACSGCLAGIRKLQEAVELLTADQPIGRHYLGLEDGMRGVNVAAAELMRSAEACLEAIDILRRKSLARS